MTSGFCHMTLCNQHQLFCMSLKKHRTVSIVTERHTVAIPPWPWKYIHLSGWHDRAGKHVAGLNFSLRLFPVALWVDLTEGESRMEWCLERTQLIAILFAEMIELAWKNKGNKYLSLCNIISGQNSITDFQLDEQKWM